MKAVHISAHAVQGLAHQQGAADVVLYDNPAIDIRATLTSDLNGHLQIINRHGALASMMLRGMIGSPLADDFSQSLRTQVESVERQRGDAAGANPVVIIEAHREVIAVVPDGARAINDFILCFDAFDKKALRYALQDQITAVLTGLRIGGKGTYRFTPIADGTYLVDSQGRAVHSFSLEGGAVGMYVSSPVNADQALQIDKDIGLAIQNKELSRVMRLYAHSLNTSTDNYRAFISAWSALEILIAKIFPTYQGLLSENLRGISAAPGLHAYLDRIADVMAGKYGLADKFSVISVFLDPESNPNDLDQFRRIKKIRDGLAHGEETPDAGLPTVEVQKLFDKYFRNHVRKALS